MADSQKKRAMKRLVLDEEELKQEPVANVSAAPLDSDMFEWHCNIQQDDVIFHLILFMPDNYPFTSPSAEFMPIGFMFTEGATVRGLKGTKVCLNIFSDFAQYHTEWKNQKGFGWSPGYTTQTVLMNLVAFLAETAREGTKEHNAKLSEGFTCADCGHTYKKPFPPLPKEGGGDTVSTGKGKAGKGVSAKNSGSSASSTAALPSKTNVQIIDYISKVRFGLKKPQSRDDLYGYGLVVSGPPHRPSLTTPCEFLSGESFFTMQSSVNVVHSTLKEELKFFLPMYIHPTHGNEIKKTFEETMEAVGKILPAVKKTATLEEKILKIIPNLMAATVVEFSKGTQHTSDNSLNGYFALHRLLLWASDTYPLLQPLLDSKLQEFIDDKTLRTKKACPHIGEWLMLLSASEKYRWTDAAEAYLYESFRRNVMWFVKDDSKLGFLDTEKEYRLKQTFTKTEVSRKILAFQVLFLDIAQPSNMTRKQIIERYDSSLGFPTAAMVTKMKEACDVIKNKMATYDDWFKVLKLKPWTEDELFQKMVDALEFSILHDGYHWSIPNSAGGWKPVMWKYKDMVAEFRAKCKAEKEAAKTGTKDGVKAAKGGAKAKGKGDTLAAKEEEVEKKKGGRGTEKAAGRGRGRGSAAGRGRGCGRGGKVAEPAKDESAEEKEDEAPKGRGGRGRRGAAGRGGRGGGRGGSRGRPATKVAEPSDEESEEEEDMEVDEAPKGRGRGRGRGTKRGAASKSPGPQRKKARK